MSDVPGTSAGNGAAAPVERTELSDAESLAAFEGLLDPPKRTRSPAPQPVAAETEESDAEPHGEAPDNAGPDPVSGEDEEEAEPDPGDDGEETDEPDQSIDPPTSWNAKDRAVFGQLPPEAQALIAPILARRESEQNAAFTRKTQEISETRKALEATIADTTNRAEQYEQNLEQLLYVASPEVQAFAQINWQQLATDSPSEYVRLTAERDALRGRIGTIQGELQRVQQQSQYDRARQFSALKQEHQAKLVELIPDFADVEKGPKLTNDMREFLTRQGFTDEEIGGVIDSRVIFVAYKAMQADRQQQARRQAETKRSQPAPTVQPPGSGRQRPDSAAAQRRAQQMAKLKRSGDPADALSLLMELV